MTIDTTSLTCATCVNPSCLGPLLLALLDEQKSLSDKVDTIYQAFHNEKPKTTHLPKENICRVCVNELVVALQLRYPEKVWSSEDFATKIGCTASAVRQTKAWKAYQKLCQNEKQQRPQRKGYKDKKGNVEAFDTDERVRV